MKKALGFVAAAVLVLSPALVAAEGKVPAGKETLTIDSMTKAKQAMTPPKKVLKGPVPFAHQTHADKVACVDCHHKEKPGETPKLDDAFHGGENDAMPALQSCIGCHQRKGTKDTKAPTQRKPCEACHSILKK